MARNVTNKVAYGTFAGAVTSVMSWVLHDFAGVTLPAGIEGAFVVIITAITSWAVPNYVEPEPYRNE